MSEWENHEDEIYEDEDPEDYVFCPVCCCEMEFLVNKSGDGYHKCHCGHKEGY